MASILEKLKSADKNLITIEPHGSLDSVLLPTAKLDLSFAICLIEKGYSLDTDVDDLLLEFENINDVPSINSYRLKDNSGINNRIFTEQGTVQAISPVNIPDPERSEYNYCEVQIKNMPDSIIKIQFQGNDIKETSEVQIGDKILVEFQVIGRIWYSKCFQVLKGLTIKIL